MVLSSGESRNRSIGKVKGNFLGNPESGTKNENSQARRLYCNT